MNVCVQLSLCLTLESILEPNWIWPSYISDPTHPSFFWVIGTVHGKNLPMDCWAACYMRCLLDLSTSLIRYWNKNIARRHDLLSWMSWSSVHLYSIINFFVITWDWIANYPNLSVHGSSLGSSMHCLLHLCSLWVRRDAHDHLSNCTFSPFFFITNFFFFKWMHLMIPLNITEIGRSYLCFFLKENREGKKKLMKTSLFCSYCSGDVNLFSQQTSSGKHIISL